MFCHTSKACTLFLFLSRTTGEFEVPEKTPISHRILVWYTCAYSWLIFYGKLVGKNTSPMDPHGIWIRVFFLSLSSRDLSLEFSLRIIEIHEEFLHFLQNFLKPKFQPPNSRQASLQPSSPNKNHQKVTSKNITGKTTAPKQFTPKRHRKCFFLPPKKRSLNCWGFLSTSGRRRGGHVQSTNAGGIGRERYTQQNLVSGCS